MLPEHVKLLKEHKKNLKSIEKPVLDEQKYEEFNEVISRALEENANLEFTYYQKGEMKQLIGMISQLDRLNRKIQIYSQASYNQLLKLDDIVEIDYYSEG